MSEESNKSTAADTAKEVATTAATVAGYGGCMLIGCALQCVLAALPVMVGFLIIGWFLRTCSGN